MATCIHCKTSSQFLTYDALSLCHHCAPVQGPVIRRALEGISTESAVRLKARNAAARLESLGRAMEHCQVLMAYPDLRLEGLQPAGLMAELEQLRTETVDEAIREHWTAARERARDAASPKGMATPYARAIKTLQDLGDLVEDHGPIDRAIAAMRAERDALGFQALAQQARMAEQQGRAKRARDLYIEALFVLKKEGTPDPVHAERIAAAEAEIARLGGR